MGRGHPLLSVHPHSGVYGRLLGLYGPPPPPRGPLRRNLPISRRHGWSVVSRPWCRVVHRLSGSTRTIRPCFNLKHYLLQNRYYNLFVLGSPPASPNTATSAPALLSPCWGPEGESAGPLLSLLHGLGTPINEGRTKIIISRHVLTFVFSIFSLHFVHPDVELSFRWSRGRRRGGGSVGHRAPQGPSSCRKGL